MKKTKRNIWGTPFPYLISGIFIIIGIVSIIYSCNFLNIKNKIDYPNSINSGEITDFEDNKKFINSNIKNEVKNKKTNYNIEEGKNIKEFSISKKLYRDMQKYNKDLVLTQLSKIQSTSSFEKPFIDLTKYGLSNNCVGYINIPAIDVKLPIYLGAEQSNMALGAVHLNCTSAPIGGKNTNCVIAAHNYNSVGILTKGYFDELPKLKIGDRFKVINFWDTLTYKVVETKTVPYDESSLFYIIKGREITSLFTCVNRKDGGYDRFFVIGERIS